MPRSNSGTPYHRANRNGRSAHIYHHVISDGLEDNRLEIKMTYLELKTLEQCRHFEGTTGSCITSLYHLFPELKGDAGDVFLYQSLHGPSAPFLRRNELHISGIRSCIGPDISSSLCV